MSRASELVIKAWKLADIVGSEHIQILRMPDPEASPSKVCSTSFDVHLLLNARNITQQYMLMCL